LQEQSQQSDKIGEITDCQNKFIEQSLRLFMKDKIVSKAQIYGVYWKIETPLSMVWKIISDILKQKGENSRYLNPLSLDFFEFNDFLNKLVREIK